MNKIIYFLFILGFPGLLFAQNVGVNTTTPFTPLHIASQNYYTLTLENTNSLTNGSVSSILFANNMQGVGGNHFSGAIESISETANSARLGFFTGTSWMPENLVERLTIANNGNVGIGILNPASKLDVAGNTHITGNLGIKTPPSTYSIDVVGTARLQNNMNILGNIGIKTPPSTYSIDVVGAVQVQNDMRINGVLNPNNPLTIGNDVSIENSLTVENGKGIVRSHNNTQMKIKRMTVNFNVSNMAAGSTLTSGNLNFGEDFAAVSIIVGNLVTGSGDWSKVLIIPYNISTVNNNCQFAVTNASNAPITFTGTWSVVAVGN